jgi:hypothetical protein
VKGKSFAELVDFIEENLKEREAFYLKSNYTLTPKEQTVEYIIETLNLKK